jgi:hypothetical protein
VRCGTKQRGEVEARKGALLKGGAHNSIKSHFKGFHKRGGANPPRGREGMSE